jgi:hypothetical protein
VTIVVFAGPTLSRRDVLARVDAVVEGPAAFGDVYRAAHGRPSAIAIIDGYFEHVPATWHKEILWAMAEGVHVFGASSMGALRAAELHSFGMVGVGRIFEAFRDGELEDDDEVAVAHGAPDTGFLAGSEAMVNIRATLQSAAEQSVLTRLSAERLTALAKATFYAQRSYPALFEQGQAAGVDAAELAALRDWLPRGRVDQKRRDAEQLLDTLRDFATRAPGPKRVSYSFEPTDAWHEAQRLASVGLRSRQQGPGIDEALLEELKVSDAYSSTHAAASARGWSIDAARRAAVKPDALAVRTAVESFRRDAGLAERATFERWREAQQLEGAELTRFFEDQARASWAEPLSEAHGRSHLLSHLRASGRYGELLERARDKSRRLEARGLASPSLADLNVSEEQLWDWYFVRRLGRAQPSDLDTFARAAGFSGTGELRRAALRELAYLGSEQAQGREPA